jgi:hypothetical protein
MISLTSEEKKAIAEQQLKSELFAEYNTSLSLKVESAINNKDQSSIDGLNNQLSDIYIKINILTTEINNIDNEIALLTPTE